jgi:hypothetical protein
MAMDPLLAAETLPRLADLAMRRAVATAVSSGRNASLRGLVDDALVRFERLVQSKARDGVRPALLFAQRDRMLIGIRAFLGTRAAARLFSLRRRDLIAAGNAAAPFDIVARGRDGRLHGIVLRSVPRDGRRLELYRRVRAAASQRRVGEAITTVTVCDLNGGKARTLKLLAHVPLRAA